MKNLTNIINETKEEAKSDFAIKHDMVSMYTADAKDYETVLEYVKAENIEPLRKHLQGMDTCSRERALNAILEDKGTKYLNELGWE